MIFDRENRFSKYQAITATAVSEDVVDFGPADTPTHANAPLPRDLGKGNPVPLRVQVVEDFATLDSLQVEVQTSSDEAFTSPEVAAVSPDIDAADLVAGKVFPITAIPRGSDQRYMRLRYVVTGSNATAGKVTAGVVKANQEIDFA